MYYQTFYRSPVGNMVIACDEDQKYITGLWIEGQKYYLGMLTEEPITKEDIPVLSAQAVGGAVAHNLISVIITCYRVVGSNGSLTGDGDKKTLIAPEWSKDKKRVLNALHKAIREKERE